MPQKEDSSFTQRFKKIWKYIVQPKIIFARETYHLVFYSRKGQPEWRLSRSMWKGAILSDLAMAFGHQWPGFTTLPKTFGHQHGVTIQHADTLGHFLLYKTKHKD